MHLTISEREVLRQLDLYITANGQGPPDTLLGERCGFTSSNASYVRSSLKSKGALDFTARYPKTSRLTDAGRRALAELRCSDGPQTPGLEAPRRESPVDLRDRAICLLVDSHTEGATEFGNALGAILTLLPANA